MVNIVFAPQHFVSICRKFHVGKNVRVTHGGEISKGFQVRIRVKQRFHSSVIFTLFFIAIFLVHRMAASLWVMACLSGTVFMAICLTCFA